MKVKGMILAILMAVILMPALASATGTASGTSLTNSVKLFYQNTASVDQTPQTTSAGTTVTSVYGYDTTAVSSDASVAPGETATYRINFINKGNVSDTFTYSLDAFDTSGSAVSWSRDLYDSSATNALSNPHTDGPLAEDADTALVIKITPPGSTGDASVGTVYVSIKTNNTPAGQYTGNNVTTYGGVNDTHTFIFVTTVGGPVMTVSKTLTVSAPASYVSNGGAATDPVPGATLSYQIIFQNTGSGTATNVWIYDTFPTAASDIGWVNGSVSDSGAAPDTPAQWSADGSSWGAEPADNSSADSVIRFGFGAIGPGVSDSVGYKLYIK